MTAAPGVLAHGGLHEAIARATTAVNASPSNAVVYLERGRLLLRHGAYRGALLDFRKAEALGAEFDALAIDVAESAWKAGSLEEARVAAGRYLEAHPGDGRAWLLKARIEASDANLKAAEAAYARALEVHPEASVELYHDAAELSLRGGNARGAAAIAARGLQATGGNVVLRQVAVQAARALGDWSLAMEHVEAQLAETPKNLQWMVMKAEVHADAGELAAARDAAERALQLVAVMPPRKAQSSLVKRWKAAAEAARDRGQKDHE